MVQGKAARGSHTKVTFWGVTDEWDGITGYKIQNSEGMT